MEFVDAGGKNAAGSSGSSGATMSARKLEEEEETFKHKKVSLSMKKRIAQARMEKKMTQKELANKLCVKPEVVRDYENGKAIPNATVINKMERALGCKLRDPKPKKGAKKPTAAPKRR